MTLSWQPILDKLWVFKNFPLVDADNQVLGRMASDIAVVLMGKHQPSYTPHVDTGDFVVVVNAEKVKLTGRKWEQKTYTWYTGYPGQKSETAEKRLERRPDRIIRDAVRRMLPKNKLGRQMLSKLKIYTGAEHPHQAQNPQPRERVTAWVCCCDSWLLAEESLIPGSSPT